MDDPVATRNRATAGPPGSGLLPLGVLTAVVGAGAALEHATADELPWFAAGAVALLAALVYARLRDVARSRSRD